jgi:hypothetical protein
MARTTNWIFKNSKKSFEEWNTFFKQKIQNDNFNLPTEDYPDFKMKLILENYHLDLIGKSITFSSFTWSVLQNGKRLTYLLIIYKEAENIGIIIEKVTGALTFLRLISEFDETSRNDIINREYDDSVFNSELFFWIISKIYNDDSNINFRLDDDKEDGIEYTIDLNSLDGLKGRTSGILNKVSTEGSDVINMLTTLSFLLESNQLTEVQLGVTYGAHNNFQIIIHLNSAIKKLLSIDVKEKEYFGEFLKVDTLNDVQTTDKLKLRSALLLMVHLDFFPTLISVFKSDSASTDTRKDLTESIIEDVSSRLDTLKTIDR